MSSNMSNLYIRYTSNNQIGNYIKLNSQEKFQFTINLKWHDVHQLLRFLIYLPTRKELDENEYFKR